MNAIDQDIRVPRIPIIDIDKSLTCYGTPLGFDINFDDTEVGGLPVSHREIAGCP